MTLATLPNPLDSFQTVTLKSVQAGGLYTSFVDLNLAALTEGLHTKGLLTRRSYMWPFPGGAPVLNTANVVGTDFEMPPFGDGIDLQLPWYSHDGVTHVGCEAYIAIFDKYTRLQFRMLSKTLVSAISTDTGGYVECVPTMGPSGMWNKENALISVARVRCFTQPNYAADRRIALGFQGSWTVFHADGSPFSTTRQAKIISMKIFDIRARPKR